MNSQSDNGDEGNCVPALFAVPKIADTARTFIANYFRVFEIGRLLVPVFLIKALGRSLVYVLLLIS